MFNLKTAENKITENKDKIFRNEYKYILNTFESRQYIASCEKYMQKDPNAGENGNYSVITLYFDTINSDDYFDKDLGACDRKKMRLRIYSHEQNWAHMEMKRKIGLVSYKDKVKLTHEQTDRVIKGDFSPFIEIGSNTSLNFYTILSQGVYRPVSLVSYTRTAFLLPFENVRITFDSNISYSNSSFDIFKSQITTPVFPDGQVVLEIKFDNTLPGFIKRMVNNLKLNNEAISKYCLSRNSYI